MYLFMLGLRLSAAISWIYMCIMKKSITNFYWILNSIEISSAGPVPGINVL